MILCACVGWSEFAHFMHLEHPFCAWHGSYNNIGIKHVFSCINVRQVPWEVLKTEAEGLPRDLANVNALKKHVRSLLLHTNGKHLQHFALFLTLFCFAFSPMSRERNFHELCLFWGRTLHISRRQQFVAPVQVYWKLRSCALTALELPC